MAEIISELSLGLQEKLKQYYLELFRKEGKCAPISTENNWRQQSQNRAGVGTATGSFTSQMGGGGGFRQENFDAMGEPVSKQNREMDTETDNYHIKIQTREQEFKYQQDIYNALDTVNTYLLIIYTLIYIFILLVILRKYYIGTERNAYADGGLMLAFLAYPLAIYTIEMYIVQLSVYMYYTIVSILFVILRFFQGDT